MQSKKHFNNLKKDIRIFLSEEEGGMLEKDIVKYGLATIAAGLAVSGLLKADNSLAASCHTSHASHASHGSHSAHASHGSHGSHFAHHNHGSHASHGSHNAHANHNAHASHSNHGSHCSGSNW